MKKLTPLLLIISNLAFAQLPTQQRTTPFDKFVAKPEIEWAAYISDTIRFEKPNLNKLLLIRFGKNEIKAAMPVGSGSEEADIIKYKKLAAVDKIKFAEMMVSVYDSLGNFVRTETIRRGLMDTASFTLTHATQILYLENGQLRSYVPWVSTMIPVYTSAGMYLGNGNYFSSCFNVNYKYVLATTNKITWLKQASQKIRLDSFNTRNKLKELFGRNLVESLWPYLLKSRHELFNATTGKRLQPRELNSELIYGRMVVPVYDQEGNVKGEQAVQNPLTPDIFTSVDLKQDWYYDPVKNMVFCSIRELTLYTQKDTGNGTEMKEAAILRVVLK